MTRWKPRLITIDGDTHTVQEWADIKGVTYAKLNARIRRNIPMEYWFTEKIPHKKHEYPCRKGNRNRMPYTWSLSAQECYYSGCRCSTCTQMPDDLKYKCRMKEIVRKLVLMYGAPEEKECIND